MLGFLQWLHDTNFSIILRDSNWAEPVIESIHVLALTLFLGFAVLLDLRLLGLCMRRKPASEVLAQLNPWLGFGYSVMIVTGLLLLISDPVAFYQDVFFRIKMLLLLLAMLNVVFFNWTAGRNIAAWGNDQKTPVGARLAAILSLVLWAAIVAAGRAIAYSLPPP